MSFTTFLTIIAILESGNDPNAIGDIHMQNKAYGTLQIRQPYLDDANRIAGTSFTMDQVRQNKALSNWCAVTYLRHYGSVYTKKTGKPATYEVLARIHNGGPNGWAKSSTLQYMHRFNKITERIGTK